MRSLWEYDIIKSVVLLVTAGVCIGQEAGDVTPTCRYGSGHDIEYLHPTIFYQTTCCMCYEFIFNYIPGSRIGTGQCNPNTLLIEDTVSDPIVGYFPHPNNTEAICSLTKSRTRCEEEWVSCCEGARSCCDNMIHEQQQSNTYNILPYSKQNDSTVIGDGVGGGCPGTWDSLQCWNHTQPSTMPTQECPSLLTKNVHGCVQRDEHYTYRECRADGRWQTNLSSGMGESHYTRCNNPVEDCHKDLKMARHYTEIVCECLSLFSAIPAIIIFCMYRTLRSQPRIKIHVHLFVAICLYEVVHLSYQLTSRHPDADAEDTAKMHCLVLNIFTKFTILSMFMWMLMEGFYLHWLMVNTFNQPQLSLFTLAGWGIPAVITAIFVTARALSPKANEHCWRSGDLTDYIIVIPLILCLALNIIFLANIMRVILTKLSSHAHQNEPSYYRRAVKATAILVPPFGLLFVFSIYSPNAETHYKDKLIADLVAAPILHLQGLIISIILCYSNNEVLGNLQKTFAHHCQSCVGARRMTDGSVMTGVSHLSTARPSVTAETALLTTASPTLHERQLLCKNSLSNGDSGTESNNNRRDSETYLAMSTSSNGVNH